MSLETITTLAGQFKDTIELQKYCDAQYASLQKALVRIKELEAEISHLQSVMTQSLPLITSSPDLLIKSTEQAICEMEIERLRQTSMNRSLTLEETKRLDLLVKNLLLSKEANKDVRADYTKLPNGVTEAQLIEIAKSPEAQIGHD